LALLSCVCLLPFFFIGGPDYYSARSFKAIWDFGHIVFFIFFAIGSFHVLRRYINGLGTSIALTFLLALLLGVAIEFLQYGIGRDPDAADIARNLFGVLIACCGIAPVVAATHKGLMHTLRLLVLLLLAVQLFDLIRLVQDENHMEQSFPLLAGFESDTELGRWLNSEHLALSTQHVSEGSFSARLRFTTEQYSGVSLHYLVSNWFAYDKLSMDIYNPEAEPLMVVLRVHDWQHSIGKQVYEDRFNRRFELASGWNTVAVSMDEVRRAPFGREMQMAHIVGLALFVVSQDRAREIYLDNLRLIAN
jgi:VanZ family protein